MKDALEVVSDGKHSVVKVVYVVEDGLSFSSDLL